MTKARYANEINKSIEQWMGGRTIFERERVRARERAYLIFPFFGGESCQRF